MKKTIVIFLLFALYGTVRAGIHSGHIYKIVSATDKNKSVFITNSSLENHAKAVLWTYTDVPSQQWEAVQNADASFSFRNAYTGKYLSRNGNLAASAEIYQAISAAVSAAKWNVMAVQSDNNLYTLAQSGTTGTFCLAISNTSDGSPLVLSAVKTGDDANHGQWYLEEVTPVKGLDSAVRTRIMNGWLNKFKRMRGTYLSLGTGGAWGDAEMMETLLDAYETTGNAEYIDIFNKVFGYFHKNVGDTWNKLVFSLAYKWYGHDFNDDVMWMVLASIRAYMLTGNTTYRDYAKRNFDLIYTRSLNQWGMLRWAEKTGNRNGTNSCINGPAEVAACYIASATGDDSYFEKARALYNRQRRYLFNAQTGQVYDSFVWDETANLPSSNNNRWASTYNQGTMLGAAVLLYNHYGDDMYRQDAEKIMDYTVKKLCNSDGIINVCQVVDGDLCGFKGILMRYVRRFIVDMNKPEYVEWMQKNAMQAYCNMNSDGVICSAWLTKSAEDYKFGDKSFAGEPFGCSTSVSAAFNTPLSADRIVKDAYAKIKAEEFDYLRGISVVAGTAGDNSSEVSGISNGRFTVYNNVNFGNKTATSAAFRVSEPSSSALVCAIEIHLDSINGACIGTVSVPNTAGWKTVKADITPTEGMHNVYLKYVDASNSGVTDCFHLDYFCFGSANTPIMSDITDNGGRLTSSVGNTNMQALTDNHATTAVTVSTKKAWFMYRSPAPVVLKSYAIGSASGDNSEDLKAWTLLASADGDTWTELDVQEDATFPARCMLKYYTVNTDRAYTYFRLNVQANNGGAALSASEWQLLGTCIFADDITADGGTLTSGNALLTDKDASTVAGVAVGAAGAIVYKAKGMYVPVHYSITSAATAGTHAPSEWTLYGSQNRTVWTILDRQTEQVFPENGITRYYNVDTPTAYQYYKLQITATDGHPNADIAEFQLFGNLAASAVLYNDITKNGGKLSASGGAEHYELTALIDNNPQSVAVIPFDHGAWIQYESPIPVCLSAYTLCSGYENTKSPRTWSLQASNDGTTWKSLDERPIVSFSGKAVCRTYPVTGTGKYRYFRFNIDNLSNASANETVIGEIQLHGLCLANNDLTANNGVKSAEIPGVKASEGYTMIFDKSAETKYCFPFYGSSWMMYEAPSKIKVDLYSITSANDDDTRDPKAWQLEASNDGNEWIVLDRRNNQSFYNRKITQFYGFDNTAEYKFYRLQLTANNGSPDCQLADWQLFFSDTPATGIADRAWINTESGVYTNSITGNLSVRTPTSAAVEIYTLKGQMVYRTHVNAGRHKISFGGYAHGIYLVKLMMGGKIKTVKIVK